MYNQLSWTTRGGEQEAFAGHVDPRAVDVLQHYLREGYKELVLNCMDVLSEPIKTVQFVQVHSMLSLAIICHHLPSILFLTSDDGIKIKGRGVLSSIDPIGRLPAS